MARFGRVITAMVTPFHQDRTLNTERAGELARWLVANGSEGIVVGGSTGESAVLSDSELLAVITRVAESVDVPVLAGVGSPSTAKAVELLRTVAHSGAQGVLAVTPYYNRPSQAGIIGHFETLAEASSLPIVLYDVPPRTGRQMTCATVAELAAHDNIVALKDATGNPAGTAAVIAATSDVEFEVYSGNDGDTLPLLAVGAVGVVSVASHWAGDYFKALMDAWQSGDTAECQRINAALIESCEFAASDEAPNPVPTKAMMRALSLDVGGCRPPMTGEPDGLEDQARGVFERLRSALG